MQVAYFSSSYVSYPSQCDCIQWRYIKGLGHVLSPHVEKLKKKCRFFLLNINFTCFLSSRFHHCIFALQDGEVPESLLINVAYFCDNGGLSAIREAFQEADPASLPFSIAHHLINIVTQVIMSNLHTIRHELFMSSIIIYCCKLFTGLTASQFSQFKTAGLLSGRL